MSLKIRLARGGAKKRPFYSIVVSDSRSPRDGRFLEKLGTYNPMVERDHPERLKFVEERVKHWLSVGAQPTDRLALFFSKAGLVPEPARRETPNKSAPKAKAQERLKAEAAAAEKAAAAIAAAAAAAAEAAAAPAPAPEPEPVVEAAAPEPEAVEATAPEAVEASAEAVSE